jgi:hypothetical protein
MILALGVGETVESCALRRDEYDLTHPVLADTDTAIYAQYAQGEMPHMAIVDPGMTLVFSEGDFDEDLVLAALLEQLWWMVKIEHEPLRDIEDGGVPRQVAASITSGPALRPESLALYWRLAGESTFQRVPLTLESGDRYRAELPGAPLGATVEYYLEGWNTADYRRANPPGAPEELHTFAVGPDEVPPEITFEPVPDWPPGRFPAFTDLQVRDNLGLEAAWLELSLNGGEVEQRPLYPRGGDEYRAVFDPAVVPGDEIRYRFRARDASRAGNETVAPEDGWARFTVAEPIPALIYDLDYTTSSGPVILESLAGMGLEGDYLFELPENLLPYEVIFVCLGMDLSSYRLPHRDGKQLAHYLDMGGRIYMEGGDTWVVDVRVQLHEYFHILGLEDGLADATELQGVTGSFLEGERFFYVGEGLYIDRIAADGESFEILRNLDPPYAVGVAYDGGTYRTVGMSIEFGGLAEATPGFAGPEAFLSAVWDFFSTPGPRPTPMPTLPPSATPAPSPSPSATPLGALGVTLEMPAAWFQPGDPCYLEARLTNPGDTLENLRLFVLLDVFGQYYFGPSWAPYPQALDWWTIRRLNRGAETMTIIPEFTWPADSGSASGLRFIGALTDEAVSGLIGEAGVWEFGFG